MCSVGSVVNQLKWRCLMKGYKDYELEKGYMGIVYGDYELFSDEKEYEDWQSEQMPFEYCGLHW